jgi:ParB family transcriptional regulator, chromosome partitioning protein
MGSKKRGLGKSLGELGLSELLGGISAQKSVTSTSVAADTSTCVIEKPARATPEGSKSSGEQRVFQLSVSKLSAGRFQPRQYFDESALQELATSIRAHGIIQPLVVRRNAKGYEIIAGERRWRAAQIAGLDAVPAIIQDLPEQAMVAIALIENIQREDLNPLEEATALDRLLNEFELTHQEVADAIGKSRAAVTNLLRLLKLNPDVKRLLERGEIDMGHARALLGVDSALQSELAQLIVSKGLSVRQVEQHVRSLSRQGPESSKSGSVDPNIMHLQGELSDKLGAKVIFRHQSKGKGQVVIHYNSVDELDGILEHIK